MRIPRNWPTLGLIVATVMLGLTACFGGSGDAAKNQQADTQATPTQTAESVAVPTGTSTLPTVTPTQSFVSAMPTAPPQFGRLKTPSVYQAGIAPVSQKLSNGETDVQSYLLAVLRSNRDVWRTTWTANGLQMPNLTYDVTAKSERYVSACTKNGKRIEVTASHSYLFYCSADNRPNGSIALPLDTVAVLWKSTDRKVADLAGAITASRTAALVLTSSLQRELSLPVQESNYRQYMATCLSGVWAHGVYGQNAFTEKELTVAMEYSYAIGVEVDGVVSSVDPTNLLIDAWVVGFRTGNVGDCGVSYWR